ncbi:hypothetical protein BT63DRAFT_427345 [Microthyrium microscopicum]|uniref:Uncharacterized protein n=1 Tax=Microthyrium microscopicum TaxID=703497 RepID=A0A6A6U5M4_9PEZI|nr:hypothetical protein BT63DRAFT_427345 [Microthyrium microscopicum]
MKRKASPTTNEAESSTRLVRRRIQVLDDAPEEPETDSSSGLDTTSTDEDSSDLSSSSDESSDTSSQDDDDDMETDEQASSPFISPPLTVGTSIHTDAHSGVTTLRMGQKPRIESPLPSDRSSILRRLQNFLPRMEDANRLLDVEREAGTLASRVIDADVDMTDQSDDGKQGQYIEMDLGLGVWEEQDEDVAKDPDVQARQEAEEKIKAALFQDTKAGAIQVVQEDGDI